MPTSFRQPLEFLQAVPAVGLQTTEPAHHLASERSGSSGTLPRLGLAAGLSANPAGSKPASGRHGSASSLSRRLKRIPCAAVAPATLMPSAAAEMMPPA